MHSHRHTQDSVSKEESPHNPSLHPGLFDPVEALQGLYAEIIPLEALVHVANELLAELPVPADREDRRDFERLIALVSKAADDAHAVLRYGTDLMEALSVYLKRDREAEDGRAVKQD